MIIVSNFNAIENSLLEKVAEELGIAARCRILDEPVKSREELITALDDPTGTLPRVLIINLDSSEAEWSGLVTSLKDHSVWKLVPIMAFGALDDPEMIKEFYALGGASCIRKPDGYAGLKAITDASMKYWLDVSHMPSDFLKDVA